MKIAIIGTGYVGSVTGACFAEHGNDVICVDSNPKIVDMYLKGQIPIEEDGLPELIKKSVDAGNLHFTTNLNDAVAKSSITFICVGTPSNPDGSANLEYVYDAARQIGDALEQSNQEKIHIIVDKSTVTVGTGDEVEKIIRSKTQKKFVVVSSPEFLAEGRAVKDCMFPSRVVVGTDNEDVREIFRRFFDSFFRNARIEEKMIFMGRKDAELTKYTANAFLATKISFMNDMSRLCEILGVDIANVRSGIMTDPRIGSNFLYPSLGFGGSCFPKDLRELIATSKKVGYPLSIVTDAYNVNEKQKEVLVKHILRYFNSNLQGKTFAIWGLAFKAGTDDVRETASFVIIDKLLEYGAKVIAYDPKAIEKAKEKYGNKIEYGSKYDVVKESDALIVCTEWMTFRNPDFDEIKALLKQPVIFDGRNLYDPNEMKKLGIDYFGIGRGKSIEFCGH